MGGAQPVKVALQFLSVLILSRLLSPDDFGVFAMAAPVLGLAMLLQDFGLTQATINRPELTQQQLSAIFIINAAVTLAVAIAVAACSPLVSAFYGRTEAGLISASFAGIVLLTGLTAQHAALLARRMRFGVLALSDLAGAAAGLLISIVVATVQPGPWALVAGSFAIAGVPALLVVVWARWMPSDPRGAAGLKDIVRFGANVSIFNLANFFSRNADNILIGRLAGSEALGLYDRAYKLLLFPLQQVAAPLGRVILPILSRLARDPERYQQAYLRTLSQLLLLTLPGIAFMAVDADELVLLLLGSRWVGAGDIFQILAIAALVQPLNWTCGWLLLSQGRDREFMVLGVTTAVTAVLSFVVGVRWGAEGVALAYAVGELLRTPVIWWYVLRRGPSMARPLGRLLAVHSAGSAGAAISMQAAHLTSLSGLALLTLSAALAYGGYVLVLVTSAAGREALGDSLSLVGALGLRRPGYQV
jgi:PST family polysaccharide transporter